MPRAILIVFSLCLLTTLAACSSSPPRSAPEPGSQAATRAPIKGGGYYKDDGPGENPPDLDRIAKGTAKMPEPLRRELRELGLL